MEIKMIEVFLEWRFLTIAPCDAAEPWQLGSQDAATPIMQGIIDLHHEIFFFLIPIFVFVSRILVRAWQKSQRAYTHLMERQAPRIGIAGPSAPDRGVPDSEDDRERQRAKIRRMIALTLRRYCAHYCGGRGLCGKYCARGRAEFHFLAAAHQIAQEFFYESPQADVRTLVDLLEFIRNNSNPARWDRDMTMHWLADFVRRDPPR